MKNVCQTLNLKIVVQIAYGFNILSIEFLNSRYFAYANLDVD